jgi:hypothetical protein
MRTTAPSERRDWQELSGTEYVVLIQYLNALLLSRLAIIISGLLREQLAVKGRLKVSCIKTLEDRRAIESDGVIVGAQTAPRQEVWTPPAGRDHRRRIGHQDIVHVVGHVNVGKDLE